MSKKEECKEVMSKLFGPAAATQVDRMSEEDCVALCRKKVEGFLGSEKARLFDSI